MIREAIIDTISELFRFGNVKASKSATLTKVVGLTVEGIEGEASADDNDLWGHAPLLYKPADPAVDVLSGGTQCQALFYQLGDRKAIFATRDLRWQIEVDDGEVVLRAMGAASPAYVHLKPDGSAKIVATTINLGGNATNFVALANLVNTQINKLWKALDTHIHPVSGAATLAPSTRLANAAPRPEPAPVMNATLPSSRCPDCCSVCIRRS